MYYSIIVRMIIYFDDIAWSCLFIVLINAQSRHWWLDLGILELELKMSLHTKYLLMNWNHLKDSSQKVLETG